MSVVGFDFGNESSIVAVARQRGIDVVLNDESKLETPALVCFGEKQRFIGTAGATSSLMNPKNTISQIKRLIGRQFSDPVVQRDIKSLPFAVTEGPDGYPLIHARYMGESRTFTSTQVLAMLFSDLKIIAEKNLNAAVVDCCIGIPVYFTDLQRRAVLDAATIAGLHPLRLFHETTATALAYGIYKMDLPENDQLNVAFVDIGHASMQVCIAGFKKGQLKILAHSFDQSLGGRDFDEVLFHHFAAKFKEEYKIDVFQNARACLRLRVACEKLKKVLSANPEAPLNIECLMEEKDVRGFIKRDEFDQISVPILERVKGPLEKALLAAQLSIENIHTVEVVGSCSRVPAIIKILTDFFKKEPRRTMSASECVARGCALQCAILSPTFKVKEYQVSESFPFSVALSWKGSGPDTQNGAADNNQSTIVFPKGNPTPSIKALTFYRSGMFSVHVQYADVSDLQAPAKISTYTIGPFQSNKGERAKLKVKARLNLHGIVSLDSATLLEEEIEVPVTKEQPKEAAKMETDAAPSDAAPPSTNETDVNMQDAKGTADASGAENGVPESGDKPVQMGTDMKADAPKRKVKKTNIPVVELVYGGMPPSDLQKAIEEEFEMALQDREYRLEAGGSSSLVPAEVVVGSAATDEGNLAIVSHEGASLLFPDQTSGNIFDFIDQWNASLYLAEASTCLATSSTTVGALPDSEAEALLRSYRDRDLMSASRYERAKLKIAIATLAGSDSFQNQRSMTLITYLFKQVEKFAHSRHSLQEEQQVGHNLEQRIASSSATMRQRVGDSRRMRQEVEDIHEQVRRLLEQKAVILAKVFEIVRSNESLKAQLQQDVEAVGLYQVRKLTIQSTLSAGDCAMESFRAALHTLFPNA